MTHPSTHLLLCTAPALGAGGAGLVIKVEHLFFAIRLVLMFKIVFKIVIFRKIVDGDPTKITKMLRNIDQHRVIAEKP